MANAPVRLQLLSRYQIVAPGQLRARGSYTVYGVLFFAAGLAAEVAPVLGAFRGRLHGPLWVLVGFGALFLLVGAWIAGMRETLEVDDTGIHDVLSTWTSRDEIRAARATLQAVRLLTRVFRRGTDSGTSVRYIVGLVVRDTTFPDALQVVSHRHEAPARKAAEEIAGALSVSFEDAVGDETIVVRPETTTAAQPERREQANVVPARARIGEAVDGPEVRIRGTLRPGAVGLAIGIGLAILLSGFAAGVVAGSMAPGMGAAAFVFGAVAGAPGFLMVAWGIASNSAVERVRVLPAEIVRETRLGGMCFRTHRLPRAEIESLRIQTRSADGYGLAVVSDRRRLLVGRALNPTGLEWLRAWLSQQL